MRRRHFALPLLSFLAGCGLLFAEVEIPTTTLTLKEQTFPGTVTGAPLVEIVTFPIGRDVSLITEPGVTFELRLLELSVLLATASPMGDFGDIESVTVSVLPPAGQTLPEEAIVATYVKAPPPAPQDPTSISVAAMSNLELSPYILDGDLTLKFVAVSLSGGAIPDWKADVGASFYLKVHLDYLEAMKSK
jgi:hypothetical protein